MGVDWVPARVRDGVDGDVLAGLIGEQARLYVVTGRVERLVGDGRHDPDDVGARERLDAVTGRLQGLLDISWDRPWRVSVIGGNPRFPPRWRDAACSTLVPAAAEKTLGRWRRWYEDCLAGGYEHYRQRLRTWDLAHEVAGVQRELVAAAAATLEVHTARTRRPEFRQVRHEVFTLADPPRIPPPGPVPPAGEDRPCPGQDEHRQAVVGHLGRLEEILRAFNQAAPGRFRLGRRPMTAQDQTGVADPWLEEFFDRFEPLVEDGHGLYLW